jgi:hypothetical protein
LPNGQAGRYLQMSFLARWESRSQPVPPSARGRVMVMVARPTQEIDQVLARCRSGCWGAGSLLVLLVAGVHRGLGVARAASRR